MADEFLLESIQQIRKLRTLKATAERHIFLIRTALVDCFPGSSAKESHSSVHEHFQFSAFASVVVSVVASPESLDSALKSGSLSCWALMKASLNRLASVV